MPKPASTTARGYGHKHRAERARWAPLVAAGHATCPRCGQPIPPGSAWDLGHHDTDRTRYTGPEHRHCNRSAGATHGNHRRRWTRRRTTPPTITPPPTAARW